MLNLDSTDPGAHVSPPIPEPMAPTPIILPAVASPAISPAISHMPQSTVVERPAAPMQVSMPEEAIDQRMVSRQISHEAQALQATSPIPKSGLLQRPCDQIATAGDLQKQAGAVIAAGEAPQGSGPPGGFSGGSSAGSPLEGGEVNAAQGSPGGSPRGFLGQQRGGPSAGSPGSGGVVNAAQGRERTEAARRGTRNSLLLSLHRVALTDLPEFQDLPIEDQSQPSLSADPAAESSVLP